MEWSVDLSMSWLDSDPHRHGYPGIIRLEKQVGRNCVVKNSNSVLLMGLGAIDNR
jgi:hypothetical protein